MNIDDHKIENLEIYNKRMSKSLIDKLFFVDKIDVDYIVDFGCADGVLLKTIAKLFGDTHIYRGYDISKDMVNAANESIKEAKEIDMRFTDNFDALIKEQAGKKSVLVLSSVIHEVYSYCSEDEIKDFWDKVWNSGFDYVAIRDMMVSNAVSRQSDALSVARIKQIYDKNKLELWEGLWGNLNENWSLVHFLLTYHYEESYIREYNENYLPISLESLISQVPKKYMPIYFEHFTLPFIRQKVEDDFGVQLQDKTHLKTIFKLRG